MKYKIGDLVYINRQGVLVGKVVGVGHDNGMYYNIETNMNGRKQHWHAYSRDIKPFVKKVGQKYKVINNEENIFEIDEIVTITVICSDNISYYENEEGEEDELYDLNHEDREVEFYEDVEEKEKEKEKMENLKEKYLKQGYLVELENGVMGHVVDTLNNGLCFNFNDGMWGRFSSVNVDLTSYITRNYDIIKVYGLTKYAHKSHLFEQGTRKLLWKREEVKKMTVEEIEKQLGHKVEVVA